MKITIKNKSGEILKTIPGVINKNLLKQIEESGIEMHSACKTGICGACICNIENGGNNLDKSYKGEAGFPIGEDEIMTCIGGIKSDKGDDITLKLIY